MEVAEQIIVMNDGKIEQSGGPRDLYEHPASEFVMGFVGPAHRLGETGCGRTTSRSATTRTADDRGDWWTASSTSASRSASS